MKRMYALALVVALSAAPAVRAQTADSKKPAAPAAKAGDGGVEQALTKIERDTLAAVLKKDVAAFGRAFSDDAVLVTPDGSTQTKPQLIADLKSGDLAITSSEMSDIKVRAFGDTAVVTYITIDKGKYKGQEISGRYRWTDVFVRRGGAWLIVAAQGTPIQGAK